MIRHIVLLKFLPDATADQVDAVVRGLRALPAEIPEIRAYECGTDLDFTDGTFDLGITALFDDHAGWQAYQDHPAHQAVIHDLIGPIRADRAGVQFEVAEH